MREASFMNDRLVSLLGQERLVQVEFLVALAEFERQWLAPSAAYRTDGGRGAVCARHGDVPASSDMGAMTPTGRVSRRSKRLSVGWAPPYRWARTGLACMTRRQRLEWIA
jgi:hypothetical protein